MTNSLVKGVNISVKAQFQEAWSDLERSNYVFAYTVNIVNNCSFPIRLLKRHWFIFDSLGGNTEVEGEGVVGCRPVIEAGQSYSYSSACNLNSEIGSMKGYYEFKNLENGKTFISDIPSFELATPSVMN